MSYDYIYDPPFDYIMTSANYLLKLKKKIKLIKSQIEILENQLKDPEINPVYKQWFTYPSLERSKITLKAFEKQSSQLAA